MTDETTADPLGAWMLDLEASTHFKEWCRRNPNAASEFREFVAQLQAGRWHPEWPTMATPLGRVLVRAAAAIAARKPDPVQADVDDA